MKYFIALCLLLIPFTCSAEDIKSLIIHTFNDPRMVSVLTCESGLRQFDSKGNVLVSPTHDYGIAQISHVWLKEAKEKGFDIINSMKDNLSFAEIIYSRQGIKGWTCSRMVADV